MDLDFLSQCNFENVVLSVSIIGLRQSMYSGYLSALTINQNTETYLSIKSDHSEFEYYYSVLYIICAN